MLFSKKARQTTREDGFKKGPFSQVRWLYHALIVSGALNIGLIATFIYWVSKDNSFSYKYKPAADSQQFIVISDSPSNEEILKLFQEMTYEQLLSQLSNDKFVENGYSYRDLALAYLTKYHNLDGKIYLVVYDGKIL